MGVVFTFSDPVLLEVSNKDFASAVVAIVAEKRDTDDSD